MAYHGDWQSEGPGQLRGWRVLQHQFDRKKVFLSMEVG